ncbi:MAG: ATP-binding cassette domain-containing protein [Candidatus Latescibacteria bacterium]|nr:ATP-binding cassette domain-containing protein [Candidatus Latescibacterota bacterium]NIM22572.1 ATP-binding cassette domain-containing protein [Candidatus Latescibacterota bacterium]NIM64861.1 ATP-binding cassette domain-containing protein [Candidatus Latescibacterota bacterium]NIO01376.1 ATP-binding cassette domain-containing protein [Candidatus Latescibacterota bacterium]NIO27886.1 ATP-binding cassette domain-containing protein [Candidatus Latescibacterota bacterium]
MIECDNIWKHFQNKPVLEGVDLKVAKGKAMVVIGQSGCGKSVLLKHLVGLLKPDRGRVLVEGEDITMMSRRNLFRVRMRFGMVFQSSALFDSLTVGENVSLALKEHTQKSNEEIIEIAREKLQMVGMDEITDKMPAELSGGMKKRVSIARAIVMNPACVLYDEPTTGLDPIMADVINNLILKLKSELHITSVIVTHDIQSAYKVADSIAMLHGGKIITMGTPDEVRMSDNEFLRQFIEGSADGPISAGV